MSDVKRKARNNLPVMRKSSSSGNVQRYKNLLPKAEWSNFCSARGDTRRELLNSFLESGQHSDKQIAEMMASQYNLQKINFSNFELDPKIVLRISRRICEKYCLIPIQEVEGTLIIAFSDPEIFKPKMIFLC